MAFSGVRLVTFWMTSIENAMAFLIKAETISTSNPIVRIRISASALNTKRLIDRHVSRVVGFLAP